MAWGNEWPVDSVAAINKIWQNAQINVPKITGDLLVTKTTIENGEVKIKDITKEYFNLKPTHDPYTNPNAVIYYECGCGAILDPGTKSFASLNNHASASGWKIRFSERGYIPHCVKCGEGVE